MERYLEFVTNHYILFLGLAVVTFLIIQDIVESLMKKYKSMTPLLAVTEMNKAETTVVDVREPNEFAESHIKNAINIPLSKMGDDIGKLESHKGKTVFVVCQNGARSGSAGNQLVKAGHGQVFVITGGMQAWEDEYKLPVKRGSKNKTK